MDDKVNMGRKINYFWTASMNSAVLWLLFVSTQKISCITEMTLQSRKITFIKVLFRNLANVTNTFVTFHLLSFLFKTLYLLRTI